MDTGLTKDPDLDVTFVWDRILDPQSAARVLQEIVDSHDKVLKDPEPIVRLHELADSSVCFVVRPWVEKEG